MFFNFIDALKWFRFHFDKSDLTKSKSCSVKVQRHQPKHSVPTSFRAKQS